MARDLRKNIISFFLKQVLVPVSMLTLPLTPLHVKFTTNHCLHPIYLQVTSLNRLICRTT